MVRIECTVVDNIIRLHAALTFLCFLISQIAVFPTDQFGMGTPRAAITSVLTSPQKFCPIRSLTSSLYPIFLSLLYSSLSPSFLSPSLSDFFPNISSN